MSESETAIEYQWRRAECDAFAPGTTYDYMKFIWHQKGHHVHLVNVRT